MKPVFGIRLIKMVITQINVKAVATIATAFLYLKFMMHYCIDLCFG